MYEDRGDEKIMGIRANSGRQTVNKPAGTDSVQHLRLSSGVGGRAGWRVSEGPGADRSDAAFRSSHVVLSALLKGN